MKNKFLIILLALAITLSAALCACGEKNTGAATPDSAAATADEGAKNAGGAAASDGGSAKASSKVSSSASSEKSGAGQASGEQENDADKGSGNGSSDSGKSSASSYVSSVPATNTPYVRPTYAVSDDPVYTFILTDTETKKTYTESCYLVEGDHTRAEIDFTLPEGKYDINVYLYSADDVYEKPVSVSKYTNKTDEDEKEKTVTVTYHTKAGKITVADKDEKPTEEKK